MKFSRLLSLKPRSQKLLWEGCKGIIGFKMKPLQFLGIFCIVTLYIVYRTTNCQHRHAEIETELQPFDTLKIQEFPDSSQNVEYLPRGIVEANSDMELKPLWMARDAKSKESAQSHQNLLAIAVGVKQKQNVDAMVQKRISQLFYFTMMAMSMGGMIFSGVIRQFILLLITRQNGELLLASLPGDKLLGMEIDVLNDCR